MQISDIELRAMLSSSVDEERRKAIIYIAREKLTQYYDLLTEIAGKDQNQDIKYLARKTFDYLSQFISKPNLASFDQGQTVERLLFSDDPYARFAGLKKALEDGSASFEPLLKQALNKEDVPQLRASFVAAIGRFKNAQNIDFFRSFLKDADARVRANAIESLHAIGSKDALKAIVAQLPDKDNRVRANVLVALKEHSSESLFELTTEMATDKSIAMRESAIYALGKFRAPKALAFLARMSVYDNSEQIRQKALSLLSSESKSGNPIAAQLLEKISEYLRTKAEEDEFVKETEITTPVSGDITSMLQSSEAANRYIAVSKITSEYDPNLTEVFKSVFAAEQNPFIISMMLTCIRENKVTELLDCVATALKNDNPRVRANAVETLGELNPAKYADVIITMLDDSNSRTVANAVLALERLDKIDSFHQIKKMLMNGQESFRLSALYVMGIIKEASHVQFLEVLIDDPSPRVRDKTLEVLKLYVTDRISGALRLHKEINERIHLFKEKDHFFENSLDHLFSSFVDMIKMEDLSKADKSKGNPKKERIALLKLADKCLSLKYFKPNFMIQLSNIENELEKISTALYESSQKIEESKEESVEVNAQLMADHELLKVEKIKLNTRREAMLCSSALDIWTERALMNKNQIDKIKDELEEVEKSMAQHVPEARFSMLPSDDAPVSEIFNVTMCLYQKHVWAFSKETLFRFMLWAGMAFGFAMIIRFMARIHPVIGLLAILGALPVGGYLTFHVYVSWKIVIACMVQDYIHGKEVTPVILESKHDKFYKNVAIKTLVKIGLLFLWLLLASFLQFIFLFLAKIISGGIVITAILKLIGFIIFILIFGRNYLKYQFIEPLTIFRENCDPFEVTNRIYSFSKLKIISLFIFATFMATIVSSTSTEIVGHLMKIFKTKLITLPLGIIALVSLVCMMPVLYSNMVIYVLMYLRNED